MSKMAPKYIKIEYEDPDEGKMIENVGINGVTIKACDETGAL